MPINLNFLAVLVQTNLELALFKLLHNRLKVLLNVVGDTAHLVDILPQVVVLDDGNLRVLPLLFLQVRDVIFFHLLQELHQVIVEIGGMLDLR